MSFDATDTIAALSTPPGMGAIGIIRVSGPAAIATVDSIFQGKQLSQQASHTVHFGHILRRPASGESAAGNDGVEAVDEVVVTLFRGPHSYTGEDVVEISCHGSPYILKTVLELCLEQGARAAQPGEFTQRAFLHGKMDLTQAEAVADLIAAETKAAQQTALHQLRGGFSANLAAMREELIHFSALIELELDFSQEDVEFADRSALLALLDRIEGTAQKLIASFRLGNALKNGVNVAIIGAPNAGKSTLLNTLLNEERAIVSDIAGTTRDTIEELLNIGGVLFRFIDTAGIREHTQDTIEQKGIERSRRKAAEADLILYLHDAAQGTDAELAAARHWLQQLDRPHLILFTKMDLPTGRVSVPEDALAISAVQGRGMAELHERLAALVAVGSVRPGDTVISNTRHLEALRKIAAAVADIRAALSDGLPGDLIALEIRQALEHIGALTGQVVYDRDILGTIFGKFCIGK